MMPGRARYTVQASQVDSIVTHQPHPDDQQRSQYLVRWRSDNVSHPPLSWHGLEDLGSVLHLVQEHVIQHKSKINQSVQVLIKSDKDVEGGKKRKLATAFGKHEQREPLPREAPFSCKADMSIHSLSNPNPKTDPAIYNATFRRKEGELIAVPSTGSTIPRIDVRTLPTPAMTAAALLTNTRDAELAVQTRYISRLRCLDPPISYHNSIDRHTPSLAFQFITSCILRPPCFTRLESQLGCTSCRPNMGANRGCEYTRKCECLEFAAPDLDKLEPGQRAVLADMDEDEVRAMDLPKRFPYYSTGPRAGCLVDFYLKERHPIYECNSTCACGPRCKNRNVQHGRKVPLEIFRTNARGFGLRCLEPLRRGQFIDVYLGEVVTDAEATRREANAGPGKASYLFSLDKFAGVNADGFTTIDEDDCYVVDGEHFGGPSRFMNHSCQPNVQMHTVSYNKHDLFVYDLAFFACEDIPAGEELTFDYMDADDTEVREDEDDGKKVKCLCGAERCRGYLWT